MRTFQYLLCLVFLLLAQQTIAGEKSEIPVFYNSGFDGDWTGEIKAVTGLNFPYDVPEGNPTKFRLLVQNGKVLVYTHNNNAWLDVMPGKFQILEHKTNAIVYAIDSSKDVLDKTGYGGWVETWNITLTKKDEKSLHLYFVRTVNNYLLPAEYSSNETKGRFIFSFTGTMYKK